MRSQLTGASISIVGQDLLIDSSTQYHNLGAYAETPDGRGFRYAKVGAVSLVPGKLYQTSAQDTTNLNPSGGLAVAAAAIGTNQVTLTSSLTIAANLLANGFLGVAVTPGQGYTYGIKGNTVVASAANCVVTLDDPLVVALTTSSKVLLVQNPYANIVVYPTTATGCSAGVATGIITNGNYGWVQTHGVVSVLNDSSTAVGLGITPSQATAGAVKTGATTLADIGYALNTGVTTEYDFVYLTID